MNISILNIELMLAIYGIVLMVAPKFTYSIKGYLKKKHTIIIGEFIKVLGLLCFVSSKNLGILILGQILSGLGYSFTAGTDSILLKSIYSKYGEDVSNEYKKVEAKSNSYMFIAFLISGILGSIIFKYNHTLVFYFSIVSNIISILSMVVISEEREEIADPINTEDTNDDSAESSNKPKIWFWQNYYAVPRAVTLATFVGFLPYFFLIITKVNMYYFGLILSLFNLSGFIASRIILTVSKRIGYQKLTASTLALTVIALLIFGIFENTLVGVIAITLLGIASGGVRPLTLSNLNTLDLNSKIRMKIVSSMEQQYGLWNAFILIGGGIILMKFGFRSLMCIAAIFYAVIMLFIRIYSSKHSNK